MRQIIFDSECLPPEGIRYVVTAVDYVMKWVEGGSLKFKTA